MVSFASFFFLANDRNHGTSKARSRALLGTVDLLVCAQHGRVENGVKVSCERTLRENVIKSLREANSGRVTDQGEEG